MMIKGLMWFYFFRVEWILPEPEPEFAGTRRCG
jgi:hypothetical protein